MPGIALSKNLLQLTEKEEPIVELIAFYLPKRLVETPAPTPAPTPTQIVPIIWTTIYERGAGGYIIGQCTGYVSSRRPDLPLNLGDAREWYHNAKRQGIATSNEPIVGAVVVTNEGWYGHVALVESIDGDNFTISEMNYIASDYISWRTINKKYLQIIGFIY